MLVTSRDGTINRNRVSEMSHVFLESQEVDMIFNLASDCS